MEDNEGLICAYILDGEGGAREIGWEEIAAWEPSAGLLWIHLDRVDFTARDWLRQESGIRDVVLRALLASGSRPRSLKVDDGALLILRGMNLNPGKDPEDMVSIRIFADANRVITLRRQRLFAVEDLRMALEAGSGPCNTGEFIWMIAEFMVHRMSGMLADVSAELDRLEEQIDDVADRSSRRRLAEIRRRTVVFHRYLEPQHGALSWLAGIPAPGHRAEEERMSVDWLTSEDQLHLLQVSDDTLRYVEYLDEDRERAEVMHDELAERLAEDMNWTLYVLSMVAAIFLPLDFVTSLLGVNVAGMPGTEHPWGFAIVTVGLVAVAGLLVVAFRKLKWLRPIARADRH